MSETYRLRQAVLTQLGFSTYHEYLESPLWASIRGHVLIRDGRKCYGCMRTARQVHHRNYEEATMRGERFDGLLSVCTACHKRAEITRSDRKTTLDEANRYLDAKHRKALRRAKKPKVCPICKHNRPYQGGACPPCRSKSAILTPSHNRA